jgi:diaminopimelate decarboxylase
MSAANPGNRGSQKPAFVDPAAFTPQFAWKKAARGRDLAAVFCEGVPLDDIAEREGTPSYAYSARALNDAVSELKRGLGTQPNTICFAVKSNGNLALLKHLAKLGCGFDIVSGGELELLRHIGVPGNRTVFSGVGKTREEMRAALRYSASNSQKKRGILLFNVESEAELEVLTEEAAREISRGGKPPSVSVRVNPDVQAGGHPHISTGKHEHKFGLDWGQAKRLYSTPRVSRWIAWHGISVHIGSQIVGLAPFCHALARLSSYVRELRTSGIDLRYLDFGGGLGVRYTNEKVPRRQDYARMVARAVRPLNVHLLLEPGRAIVGPAGVLLTRVLYVKKNRRKKFVVVDAAMNDLMRPALYGAVHPITRVTRNHTATPDSNHERVDLVGPVCETGDCFLHDWPLGSVQPGDLLAIWVAGAYGMAQTSNYNARCRPAEVLVQGNRYHLIRRRETHTDIIRTQLS